MRIFTKLFILMTLVATALTVGCTENQVEEKKKTELSITLEKTALEIDGNGGEYSIGYTIENGINGIDIAAEADVEWITNIRTAESRLYFTCDKNFTSEAREATLAVRYPNYSTQVVRITQQSSDALTFEIEISDITSTSCTTKLSPSNQETPYIVYMSEVSYFYAANIDNETSLFLDDYNTYTKWAEDYGASNLEQFMYLNQFAFQGDTNITWTGMVPDREYVVYAYAIEFTEDGQDYTLASAVSYQIVTLPTRVFTDIEFDVTITVDGPKATYEFEPVNWDGKYYIEIFAEGDYMYRPEGTTPDDEYCKQVANNWIYLIEMYMQSGYSAETLLEFMCLQGPDSYSEIKEASTNYCMVFYGIEMVDGLPQVTTKPYFAHFRTEEVKPSDMTIEISVENCYVRVADICIAPSNEMEQYVATFLTTESIPAEVTTNEDIINWLLGFNLSSNTYKGTIETTLVGLEPDTEYTALAFGYYGGVVTTDLFRYDFKTEPESECQNEVIGVNITGPYSLLALETALPDEFYQYGMFESMGWYAMCASIETENPNDYVFMNTYAVEELVTADMDYIKADVVQYTSPRNCLFVGENDKLYVMCAVTMDYKGNYSDMWVSEPFSFSFNNGTLPVEELLDKLGYTTTQSATRSSIDLRLKK
ncbi:MAG: BACON domain-containing protein [Alistipes sp.]|nr:BACON domain-containing protein [Alistipes sp.]